MTLPILHLSGTPYEQGVEHGRRLRNRIAHNLAVYFDRFEREVKLPRMEVVWRARQYRDVLGEQNADYFNALLGVVDGSDCELDELVALNVRYEILYYQFGVNALRAGDAKGAAGGLPFSPDGCTALAVLPEASANGHLLLGQNWDWIPQVQGVVLHTIEADGRQTLCLTEAGIVGGKIGLNSAGLGLCINGMTTTDDDWTRLSKPFHLRCYEVLRARDFDDAVQVVTDGPRACSANFLIAQIPDHVTDIEAAPRAVRFLSGERGCLAHTNHFLDPDALGVVEPPCEHSPHSQHRFRRLNELLQTKRPLSIGDLQTFLRDHEGYPHSICRHADPSEPEEERYATLASVVMDLHERTMWLTDGQPCEGTYFRINL